MADLSAIQAYQAALRTASGGGEGAGKVEETAGLPNFSELVGSAVMDTQASLQGGEQMSAAGATGEAELVDVVTALSAAELQLETVVAVRDEVIKAYREILQMPI